uniref:Uncharacterized protein n=1 Tax=viral metagenome TaxID=1070528 RepID=A0A6M3XRL7_9ZZZZ
MIVLEMFSHKDIRTCARVLRKAGKAGLSAENIVEYADYLTEIAAKIARSRPTVRVHKGKYKRTPEEMAARKRSLIDTKYGPIRGYL